MRLPKTITARWLKRIGACNLGINEFKRAFPEGCELDPKKITARRVKRLVEKRLWSGEISWFICELLRGFAEQRMEFINQENFTKDSANSVFYARWLRKAIRLNQAKGKG